MKKIFISLFLFAVICIFAITSEAFEQEKSGINISGKLFSVLLPEDVKGLYTVKKKNNAIFIYDKMSEKAGYGGLAFGIKAYKEPADHAMMPGGRKIGELLDKKRILYDIVLIQPTDVQFDYTKEIPKSYERLYKIGNDSEYKIQSKSDSIYYDKGGTKGEDLYQEVLKKHVKAIKEKWDSAKLEQENMSYMYNVLGVYNEDLMNKIGYTYYDTNGDGIDELLIGEIAQGEWKGVIYDIYTTVNRRSAHVVSGGTRDRYYVCDETFLCNEYSSGADENGVLVYNLVENSTELFPQVGFKYDGYKSKINPWFISYNFAADEWQNVSKETYDERKSVFDKYKRFEYIPLSKFGK